MKIITNAGVDDRDVVQYIVEMMGLDSYSVQTQNEVSYTSNQKQTTSKLLTKYGRNLTQYALESKVDPVIGRETEIQRLIQILSRRTKN
ncbi:MAG: ATP-dependent Clp protease ATP-binding subunit ClpC, partial [Bacilli bacterium]